MFTRIVGQSIGAALFGALLNYGIYSRAPEAGGAVNRLLSPLARQTIDPAEIAHLSEAIAAALHNVYVVSGLVALVSLLLALALPPRLSPTRHP